MKHGDRGATPCFATREGQGEAPGGFANQRPFCTSDGECVRAYFDVPLALGHWQALMTVLLALLGTRAASLRAHASVPSRANLSLK